ncbi:carboxylesterase/lipase family protein [Lentzea sp. JNUCC 0626]|uniref:carboxylesterase/lipase family protein n=1 Tax=Lentzea sp. JNUCC 0626 TaxID=3367513 RepID=UPI003749ADD9
MTADPLEIVLTTSGRVRGLVVDGVIRHRAVPYAAPPAGRLRFAPAAPAPRWDGVRDATGIGATAPQHARRFPGVDMTPLLPDADWAGGHDYLTVNVWAPARRDQPLPVMVYLHGGAFVAGSGDCPAFDGAAFARSGVVLMTINYRLGIEGFAVLDDAPRNLGLRDQIAALAWVRDNAAGFGGDPGNVTVFGESAGAMSIATLLVSGAVDGLCDRAIVQSGHDELVRDPAVGRRLTEQIAAAAGAPATAAGLRSVPVAELLDAQRSVLARPLDSSEGGWDPAYQQAAFAPVVDGEVVRSASDRGMSSIPLLIGTTRAEMNLYAESSADLDTLSEDGAVARLAASRPDARRVLSGYGLGQAGRDPGRVLVDALTDLMFRSPSRRFALRHGGPVFAYEFEWESPLFDGRLGACHGLDLPFVFDNLGAASGRHALCGAEPPAQLAAAMNERWIRFATTGDPGWPQYDDRRLLMRFGGGFAPQWSRVGVDSAPLEASPLPARLMR